MLLEVDPLSTICNNELIAKAEGKELEISAVTVFVSNTLASSPRLKRRYTVPLKSKLTLETRDSRLDSRALMLETFEDRVSSLESQVSSIESRVSSLEYRVSSIEKQGFLEYAKTRKGFEETIYIIQ